MIRVIILDFDGVIVESLNIKTQAFRDLFNGYPRHLDEIMSYHLAHNAISRYIKFEHIVTHILGETYNTEREKELGARYSKLVCQKVIECPYVAGAEEFLQYFSPKVPLYLASASPQDEIEVIVKARGIDRYFKEMYGFPCKKYDVIHRVMSAEKVNPGAIAYIGDSREDYKVARETGVFFIGRMNEESFDNLGIPVYQDLFGVKTHLQRMIDGNEP